MHPTSLLGLVWGVLFIVSQTSSQVLFEIFLFTSAMISLFTSTMGSLSGVMGVELASLYFLRGHSLALSCLVCKQHWLIYVGWFFQCLVQRGERASGLRSGSAFVLERPSCWAQSSSLVLPLQRCLGFQCQRCLLTHGLNKKVLFCSQLSFSPCCRSHYLISFHM